HLPADQIGGQCRQPVVLTFRPTVFDPHILAFDIARFLQALAERRDLLAQRSGRSGIEEADHSHRRLLRARREWPGSRGATEQRYELAPFHSITLSARSTRAAGTSWPIAFAVLRLMISSNLVGCSTGESAGFVPRRSLASCRLMASRHKGTIS